MVKKSEIDIETLKQLIKQHLNEKGNVYITGIRVNLCEGLTEIPIGPGGPLIIQFKHSDLTGQEDPLSKIYDGSNYKHEKD